MAVFRLLFVLVAVVAGGMAWYTTLPVNGGASEVTAFLLLIGVVALAAAAVARDAQ